jgi:hypothetical protein
MTLNELAEEMEPFHNHIGIICDHGLGRLVGVGEDEDDLYYIVDETPGRRIWYSAVGAFESLKGKIDRYTVLDSIFKLNGCPLVDKFMVVPHVCTK